MKHYGNKVARNPKTSRAQQEASRKSGRTSQSRQNYSQPAPKGLAIKRHGGG